jgi:hypothetical protein
VELADMHES